MKLLQDGMIAMLAAIGVATLLWLFVSLFLRAGRETIHNAVALIPARGGAGGLEHAVRTLQQIRLERGGFGAIVIVDCGLSEEGRQIARLLAREERDISLCRREDVSDFLQ